MYAAAAASRSEMLAIESLVPPLWQKFSMEGDLELEDSEFQRAMMSKGNNAFGAAAAGTAIALFAVIKRHVDYNKKPLGLMLPVPVVAGLMMGDWARRATVRPMLADALALDTAFGEAARDRFQSKFPLSPLLEQARESIQERRLFPDDKRDSDRFEYYGDTVHVPREDMGSSFSSGDKSIDDKPLDPVQRNASLADSNHSYRRDPRNGDRDGDSPEGKPRKGQMGDGQMSYDEIREWFARGHGGDKQEEDAKPKGKDGHYGNYYRRERQNNDQDDDQDDESTEEKPRTRSWDDVRRESRMR